MDKKRGHRCTCNQRNGGACPLRSECPPTRLANIGSFEKGWEDGEDSHPVTCRSKSEVLGEETVPASFPKALVRPAFHLPGSVLWERSRACTLQTCAFHHRFAPNSEARSSQKACPSKGTSDGSWTWHNSSLGWHRTILPLSEPTAPTPLYTVSHRGGLCTWPLHLVSCLPLVLPELAKPEAVLMITKLAVFFGGEAGGGLGSWCRMWAVRLCPPSLLKGTVLQSPPYTGTRGREGNNHTLSTLMPPLPLACIQVRSAIPMPALLLAVAGRTALCCGTVVTKSTSREALVVFCCPSG